MNLKIDNLIISIKNQYATVMARTEIRAQQNCYNLSSVKSINLLRLLLNDELIAAYSQDLFIALIYWGVYLIAPAATSIPRPPKR